MDSFFLFAGIFLALIFIAYFAVKAIKYIVYNISHAVAKGVYDARNGVVIEQEKVTLPKELSEKLEDSEIILSNAEKKIRGNWRTSLLIYLFGSFAVYLVGYCFLAYHGDTNAGIELLEEGFGMLLGGAIYLGIMFYFAYIKFGTKWIGWFLYVSPIRTVFELIQCIVETCRLPDITITGFSYVMIFYFSLIFFYVYFWIESKKMYDLNHSIKKRKMEKENFESGLTQAS